MSISEFVASSQCRYLALSDIEGMGASPTPRLSSPRTQLRPCEARVPRRDARRQAAPDVLPAPGFKTLRISYIGGTLLRRTQPPSPRVLRTPAAVDVGGSSQMAR